MLSLKHCVSHQTNNVVRIWREKVTTLSVQSQKQSKFLVKQNIFA